MTKKNAAVNGTACLLMMKGGMGFKNRHQYRPSVK